MQPVTISVFVEVFSGLIVLGGMVLAIARWRISGAAVSIMIIASLLALLSVGIDLLTVFVVDPMIEERHSLSSVLIIDSLVEGIGYGFNAIGLFLMCLAVFVDRPRLTGQPATQKEPLELVQGVAQQVLPSLTQRMSDRSGTRRGTPGLMQEVTQQALSLLIRALSKRSHHTDQDTPR